jgi:hypothetical protein
MAIAPQKPRVRTRPPVRSHQEIALKLCVGLQRDLRPALMPDPSDPQRPLEFLQHACEGTLLRVADTPKMSAAEARALFARTRSLFRAQEQLRAFGVIETHLARAGRVLSRGRR